MTAAIAMRAVEGGVSIPSANTIAKSAVAARITRSNGTARSAMAPQCARTDACARIAGIVRFRVLTARFRPSESRAGPSLYSSICGGGN